jgi:hypothetical protein
MPPQQAYGLPDLVGERLDFGAHGFPLFLKMNRRGP